MLAQDFILPKFAAHLIAVCLQNVAVPLSGDANAVKKYADEMQKIKKQVGCLAWLNDKHHHFTVHPS